MPALAGTTRDTTPRSSSPLATVGSKAGARNAGQKIRVKRFNTEDTEEKRRKAEKDELLSARFSRVDSLTFGCNWFLGRLCVRHAWLSEELRQKLGRQRRIEIIRDYDGTSMHPERANSV